MKGVIISAVIAALIVVGGVMYTNHIENVSKEMGEINTEISDLIMTEQFTEARRYTTELQEYLNKHRAILAATGNHEEFDLIEMNISGLIEYIEGSAKTDALSSCHVLDSLFEHLPKNYELKLENIL